MSGHGTVLVIYVSLLEAFPRNLSHFCDRKNTVPVVLWHLITLRRSQLQEINLALKALTFLIVITWCLRWCRFRQSGLGSECYMH